MKEPLTLFAGRTAGAVGLVGSVFLICDCTASTQQLGFVEDPAPPVLTDPDAGSSDGAATHGEAVGDAVRSAGSDGERAG